MVPLSIASARCACCHIKSSVRWRRCTLFFVLICSLRGGGGSATAGMVGCICVVIFIRIHVTMLIVNRKHDCRLNILQQNCFALSYLVFI